VKRGGSTLALAWLGLALAAALLAPALSPADPYQPSGPPLSPPGRPHPLGTDQLGRDLLARLLFGGRLSLGASAAASLLTVTLGGGLGLAAALLGGLFDQAVRGLANVLLAIPGLLLAMLLVATLGPGLPAVVLAVGIGGMPGYARITRSLAIQLLQDGYMDASRSLGAGGAWIAARHLLPNSLPQLIPLATTHFAWALLGVTTLSFLGLAGDPSIPEWGALLNTSRAHLLEAPWGALWPALAISLTILSVHAWGHRLAERLPA
jgi:peptide/nickel transport system permease protein